MAWWRLRKAKENQKAPGITGYYGQDHGLCWADPQTMQWNSVDPYAVSFYWQGTYVYMGGDPVNRVDATGGAWHGPQNLHGTTRTPEELKAGTSGSGIPGALWTMSEFGLGGGGSGQLGPNPGFSPDMWANINTAWNNTPAGTNMYFGVNEFGYMTLGQELVYHRGRLGYWTNDGFANGFLPGNHLVSGPNYGYARKKIFNRVTLPNLNFTFRSFAPWKIFGFPFLSKGDDRGFSTLDGEPSKASLRVEVDPSSATPISTKASAGVTVQYGPWARIAPGHISSSASVLKTHSGFELYFSYHAAQGALYELIGAAQPTIDVFGRVSAAITLTEDGFDLLLTGSFSGDGFPNFESYVNISGHVIPLVQYSATGIAAMELIGRNYTNVFSKFSALLRFDKKGNLR